MDSSVKNRSVSLEDLAQEEKGILAAYYYLQRLQRHVLQRDLRRTRVSLRRMARVAQRLDRFHRALKTHLATTAQNAALREKAEVFNNQTVAEFSRGSGAVQQLFRAIVAAPSDDDANADRWHQIEQHVHQMETTLPAWEAVDDALLAQGIDLEKKMGPVVEVPPKISGADIDDIIAGRGTFSDYTAAERNTLAVRAVLVAVRTNSRILEGKKIQGLVFEDIVFPPKGQLEDVTFDNCTFRSCRFDTMIFSRVVFKEITITSCTARKTVFAHCRFRHGALTNSNFFLASFSVCTWNEIVWEDITCRSAGFEFSLFEEVSLITVDFSMSRFLCTTCVGRNGFYDSLLQNVSFVRVEFGAIQFEDCTFRQLVDFRRARFSSIPQGELATKMTPPLADLSEDERRAVRLEGSKGTLWEV